MNQANEIEGLGDVFGGSTLAVYDTIASLTGQYREVRERIRQIAAYVEDGMAGAMSYFLNGNADRHGHAPDVKHLFREKGAVAALNSDFWQRVMHLTDVLDAMPQKRREEWQKSIQEQKCPDFDEQIVRDTFADLMASRAKFFAERVDGIFRSLSGEHVTNRPEGFSKRMIIAYVLSSYGTVESSRVGYINDLRCVIAKLMGRDQPKYNASDSLIRALRGKWGEWISVDGGALRVRLYMKGTAHLEVHPEMAWRLNTILASIYPRAIPPQYREKPKRMPKDIVLIQKPLPFAVLSVLACYEAAYTYEVDRLHGSHRTPIANAVHLSTIRHQVDRHLVDQAEAVLESIGGVKEGSNWQFDYQPQEVINQICASGCIPDDKSHQFYATRGELAHYVIEQADIGPADRCLEPQAGLGDLADLMPKDRTVCVEISALRCKVLEAKGYKVECADFLRLAAEHPTALYDRIVMNPPFDRGQWRAHLEAAASLLSPRGRLVSVLPSGARTQKNLLPGFVCTFLRTFDDAFAGTSVSVVVLVVERAK